MTLKDQRSLARFLKSSAKKEIKMSRKDQRAFDAERRAATVIAVTGDGTFNYKEAHERRLRAGKRLIDVAFHADCSPSTVRSFEFGAPVRSAILARLQRGYELACKPKTKKSRVEEG